MIAYQYRLDTREVRTALRRHPKTARKIASRAINRSARSGRTEGKRRIRKRRNLRARDIQDRLKLRLASPARLTATIAASMDPVPLKFYRPKRVKVRRTATGRGRRRAAPLIGVKVAVIPGKARVVPGAFFAGNDAPVVRKGRARYPLRSVVGPSIRASIPYRTTTETSSEDRACGLSCSATKIARHASTRWQTRARRRVC